MTRHGDFLKDFCYSKITSIIYRLGICIVYDSRNGVKCMNPSHGILQIVGDEEYINPEELFLDVDYLCDKKTLLGKNIIESPHLGLMMILKNKGDIYCTDYVDRFITGTLDGRVPGYVGKKTEKRMRMRFEQGLIAVERQTYEPVKYYEVRGKKYVYDGKHRAAMCALSHKSVKCVKVQFCGLGDGEICRKYNVMCKNKEKYRESIAFLEKCSGLGEEKTL